MCTNRIEHKRFATTAACKFRRYASDVPPRLFNSTFIHQTFDFEVKRTHGLTTREHPSPIRSNNLESSEEKRKIVPKHIFLCSLFSYFVLYKSMKRILYTWQQYRSTRRQTWINKTFRYATKSFYWSGLFINAVDEVSLSRMTNNRLFLSQSDLSDLLSAKLS